MSSTWFTLSPSSRVTVLSTNCNHYRNEPSFWSACMKQLIRQPPRLFCCCCCCQQLLRRTHSVSFCIHPAWGNDETIGGWVIASISNNCSDILLQSIFRLSGKLPDWIQLNVNRSCCFFLSVNLQIIVLLVRQKECGTSFRVRGILVYVKYLMWSIIDDRRALGERTSPSTQMEIHSDNNKHPPWSFWIHKCVNFFLLMSEFSLWPS